MSPMLYDGVDHPVEIKSGRGDLRYSSAPFPLGERSLDLLGGKTISYAQIFAEQQWVAAAVMRLLTWSIRVPLKVYRRTGDDSRIRLRDKDHPLAAAINTPWERGSQAELTMSLLGPMLVHGNALDEVQEGRSGKLQFTPQDWRYVKPLMPFRDTISGWEIVPDQYQSTSDQLEEPRTVPADSMCHMHWWSPLGPMGVSPLQMLGTTLGIEDAAQRHQKAMFLNGARPPSAVQADVEFLGIDKDERQQLLQQLRDDISALYAGPENAGRPALLPPGLTWNPIGHNAEEMALIEQRQVTREEICAVFQIPPPMLGILDRATFSNIETQKEMAYTDAVGPPMVLIESLLNAQLVRGLLREDDIYLEYDFAGVLRGDKLKEIQAIKEAIASGVMSPNEGRTKVNEPQSDIDGMDDFYLPLNNLQPVAYAKKIAEKQATAPVPFGGPGSQNGNQNQEQK